MLLHLALLTVGFAAGCYPKTGPAPGAMSPEDAQRSSSRWPGVTASALAAGREHFVAKCNGCHGYPDLTAIPEERWPSILDRMAKKSNLTAGERDDVLHFILASRAEHAG